MPHYVNPNREQYFRFSTGSNGPFTTSGSMDVWSFKTYLLENAEWLYGTGIPQTRINWVGQQRGMHLPTDRLLDEEPTLVYTEGPFMLNLTSMGDTMPLFTKVLARTLPLTGSNDSEALMKVHLRQMGPKGTIYTIKEIGTFNITSSDYQWYTIEGGLKDLNGNGRSMLQGPRETLNLDFPISTRTTRSLTSPNTVVKVPMFYLDIWGESEVTGANRSKRVMVAGLYCQETSISGGQ